MKYDNGISILQSSGIVPAYSSSPLSQYSIAMQEFKGCADRVIQREAPLGGEGRGVDGESQSALR